MLLFVLLLTLAILAYIKLCQNYKYWTAKGVLQIKPLPLVGNFGPIVLRTQSFADLSYNFYNCFPHERYYGFYRFINPTLLIRCPELIKTVLVKEFTTFPQHVSSISPDVDPLFSNNLFTMNGGQRWQDLRSILSPAFTRTKLKQMFGLMQQCATQFLEHFQKQKGSIIIEMKDVFSRYTNDVIGTTAFGVSCNSFRDPENKFFLTGKDITNITVLKIFKLLLICISPIIPKILKVRIVSKESEDILRSIISETLQLREKHHIVRPDLLHLLMEARKTKPEIVLTDEDITAQAFFFFLAGFETASTAMCFTSYELALNYDIQKKLQLEVDQVLESGEVSFDKLLEMKYMEMVVLESLRKWPPVILTDRKSSQPFTLNAQKAEDKVITLESGTNIWIPIYGLHRDPKYYPQPNKFDPERFNDTNKSNIHSGTYLPFGIGPKNCIGSRFALLEVKLILFYILSRFEIFTTEKTPIPIVLAESQFFPVPKGGFWLELRARDNLN